MDFVPAWKVSQTEIVPRMLCQRCIEGNLLLIAVLGLEIPCFITVGRLNEG